MIFTVLYITAWLFGAKTSTPKMFFEAQSLRWTIGGWHEKIIVLLELATIPIINIFSR